MIGASQQTQRGLHLRSNGVGRRTVLLRVGTDTSSYSLLSSFDSLEQQSRIGASLRLPEAICVLLSNPIQNMQMEMIGSRPPPMLLEDSSAAFEAEIMRRKLMFENEP